MFRSDRGFLTRPSKGLVASAAPISPKEFANKIIAKSMDEFRKASTDNRLKRKASGNAEQGKKVATD